MNKDIYNMKLHDEIWIRKCNCVVRVPGGWIYTTDSEDGAGGYNVTSVFVPYNNELQG